MNHPYVGIAVLLLTGTGMGWAGWLIWRDIKSGSWRDDE